VLVAAVLAAAVLAAAVLAAAVPAAAVPAAAVLAAAVLAAIPLPIQIFALSPATIFARSDRTPEVALKYCFLPFCGGGCATQKFTESLNRIYNLV
jgi:hypothetical protein